MTNFYSADHIGNRFGIKGPDYGPHGHLGVDFNKMPSGTSIPAWAAGHVVQRGYSTNLGNYLIVKTSLGYVGYHHMLSQAFKVPGDNVNVGDIVGRLGMTGLLATGVHLHTTLADSATVGGFDVHDPLPHINLGTAPASTSSRPIGGDTPAPPIPPQESNMRAIASTAGPGAVVGEFTFQTFNQFPGTQALDRLQAYAKIFNPNGQIIMVSPEEFTVAQETVTAQRGALLSDIKSTVK